MPEIEHRIELDAVSTHPDYSGREFSDEEIAAGGHREFVGGAWGTHGQRQLDFLKSQGMLPEHRLLDIGCGSFRAGRHFIDFLDAGNYYGIDANHSLMQTGYDLELSDEQRTKTPITHLRANDRFDGDFGVEYEFAIANSVFSHVSLNHIRLALYRLDKVMAPGGSFYATFFERKATFPIDAISELTKNGKGYFTEKNNFWYFRSDLRWAATFGHWKVTYIGDWGHPAGQRMMQFTKMTATEIAAHEAKTIATKAPASVKADLRKHAGRGKRWAKRKLNR
jgi:SAM-dependent methyltransferase